jgi:hypothetical protein
MNDCELIEWPKEADGLAHESWAFIDVIDLFEGLIVVQQIEKTDV